MLRMCNDSKILKSDTDNALPKMEKLSVVTNVSQAKECSRIGEGSGFNRNLPVRTDLPKCCCIRLWRFRSVEPT